MGKQKRIFHLIISQYETYSITAPIFMFPLFFIDFDELVLDCQIKYRKIPQPGSPPKFCTFSLGSSSNFPVSFLVQSTLRCALGTF